jgi:hypothetical protein
VQFLLLEDPWLGSRFARRCDRFFPVTTDLNNIQIGGCRNSGKSPVNTESCGYIK